MDLQRNNAANNKPGSAGRPAGSAPVKSIIPQYVKPGSSQPYPYGNYQKQPSARPQPRPAAGNQMYYPGQAQKKPANTAQRQPSAPKARQQKPQLPQFNFTLPDAKTRASIRNKLNTSVIYQMIPVLLVALSTFIFLMVAGRPVSAVGSSTGDNSPDQSQAIVEMAQEPALSEGISYLSAQAAKSPDLVDQAVKDKKMAELRATLDEKRQKLVNGEVDVWTLFDDYVLMGDSRAYGFVYYGFMPKERVFAKAGTIITWVEERMDDLKLVNPSRIYLCFGVNDIGIGYWKTPEEYAQGYDEVLKKVKKELPGVQFYVSSTISVKDPGFKKNKVWYKIPEFNEALKEMCEREGYVYVDNSGTEEAYPKLWDSDGIHLQKAFYPHWATNMIMAEYEMEAKAAMAASDSKSEGNSDGSSGGSGN